MDDPLPGCLSVVKQHGNAITMLRGLLLRLRLFHNEKISARISDQIIEEAKFVKVESMEYTINEVKYEMRLAKSDFNTMFETTVIANWSKHLLKYMEENDVLDFVSQLKKNRARRKRS